MLTGDSARKLIRDIVHKEFGESYREYVLLGVGFGMHDQRFAVTAYMENSPLHPKDLMQSRGWLVDFDENVVETVALNAVAAIKSYIDKAHDSPSTCPILKFNPLQ